MNDIREKVDFFVPTERSISYLRDYVIGLFIIVGCIAKAAFGKMALGYRALAKALF